MRPTGKQTLRSIVVVAINIMITIKYIIYNRIEPNQIRYLLLK
jgi:hypothetical protein